jgi:hypothetical protein
MPSSADRPRRLAHDGVPHTYGRAFFGGTYYPPERVTACRAQAVAAGDRGCVRERRADIERDAGAITEQLRDRGALP